MKAASEKYHIGQKVNAVVTATSQKSVEVVVVCKHKKSSAPQEEISVKGLISIAHLSDYPHHCKLIHQKLSAGDELKGLIVIGRYLWSFPQI